MKPNRTINIILINLLLLWQTADNFVREMKYAVSWINPAKNAFLLLTVGVLACEYVSGAGYGRRRTAIFKEETRDILYMTASFAVLSLYFIVRNRGFEPVTAYGLFKIAAPVLAVFFILNEVEPEDIYRCLAINLIISFAVYLIAKADRLSLESFLSMSMRDSYSPFESNYFSPAAIALTLFFCYYRRNKVLMCLSVIFTIMTFKRIMVIYAVFLLIFGGVAARRRGRVPRWVMRCTLAAFVIRSVLYVMMMQGRGEWLIQRILGLSIGKLTMNRSGFMQAIMESDYVSHGFMTSTILDIHTVEADIPMLYLEMGWLAVISLIYFILRLARKHWYNYLIIVFCFLELLTSHWLDITYFWIVMYITIGCIAYQGEMAPGGPRYES